MSESDPLPALPRLQPGRYRHYKGGEYEVVGVARHSESLAAFVVYRPLYNQTGWWVRPFEMFTGEITSEGHTQARFALVAGDASASPEAALLATLQALEAELHHPGARCSPARLDQLLHAGFREVGRSGRPYTRETVLQFLAGQAHWPDVLAWGHAVQPLGPDTALLTYQSAHRAAGDTLVNTTHRSSVWQRTQKGWQLLYHQGTPAAEGT
ncbi:MAG TPA: DUF1653 domain-containing protein [Ideonella sp.]|uniref:DUF1653 domain-containing protein n=1 Tax=Ideonella sp. TaxID=1929293 RepID=UPI002BB705C5|nr:DUF1653 domain-containing protein [Ideonella sp.]HSI48924.1 DUF1653 domain-containing protein [Ideonella sp.]